MRFSRTCFVVLISALLGLPMLRAQREKIPPDDLEIVEKNWPDAKKTVTGMRYEILEAGHGESPKPGAMVAVNYVGRLLDGKVFDEVSETQPPFKFRVGRDQVILGWDQILQLMKPGEKRLVIIPPELGYGSRGAPPRIPRNATLVFMIWLREVVNE
ncbi:FKBP-type peptidyl-prolyl cis-trans isomerase [Horticoccus luteus]|uniref:Peptidyl-prolyl cis-trans isomerase n=1 Tax=Horticoccus luteus TaxID=2862869 RepID=A0A8F9TT84_9BACT|nr:FKBP-type peptidyl-prolyl cis-trans isomerase [Horticoccus luteus]QYM78631.1 FKBP-type peptidyl-prolyl cis-trans isomerase [Horticoccus luteus]